MGVEDVDGGGCREFRADTHMEMPTLLSPGLKSKTWAAFGNWCCSDGVKEAKCTDDPVREKLRGFKREEDLD